MRKLWLTTALILALGGFISARTDKGKEAGMDYCSQGDLIETYGEDRIGAWSRLDVGTVERAIAGASAEIDGYLLSGGYAVPLAGAPATLKKYCVDIASASLVLSAGVLDDDPEGKAVLEQAKVARRYLEKVAEGKFKIPGYSAEGETSARADSGGNVKVWARERMRLKGY
jgi:phage gp36-like protein